MTDEHELTKYNAMVHMNQGGSTGWFEKTCYLSEDVDKYLAALEESHMMEVEQLLGEILALKKSNKDMQDHAVNTACKTIDEISQLKAMMAESEEAHKALQASLYRLRAAFPKYNKILADTDKKREARSRISKYWNDRLESMK